MKYRKHLDTDKERAFELYELCDDMETKTFYSSFIKFLMTEMNISFYYSRQLLIYLEDTYNLHFVRKRETEILVQQFGLESRVKDPKEYDRLYYLYKTNKDKLDYRKLNIAQIIKEKYGIDRSSPDFDKIYARLYKQNRHQHIQDDSGDIIL